jgi:hypothetical protein
MVSFYLQLMNYRSLIAASKDHLARYPGRECGPGLTTMFPSGARWMYDRLNELDDQNTRPFDPSINYNGYGFLKYGICLLGFLSTSWWLLEHAPLLTPLSVLSFYVLEVQFLFLFPLLIDHSSKPIRTGLNKVFEIGIVKCLSIVMPIALMMLLGLFRKRNTLTSWHVGCLAILIWYHHEVRTRI